MDELDLTHLDEEAKRLKDGPPPDPQAIAREYWKNLHFVVEDVKEKDDATELMKTLYCELADNSVCGDWISHSECLQMKTQGTGFFIMDPFSGPVFDHLVHLRCRVVGPLVVLRSFKEGSSIPKYPYPVYSLIMAKVVVTCTNISKPIREEMSEKVKLMGGYYFKDLKKNVTHLISGYVGSKKYHMAATLKIPVFTISWVYSMWDYGQYEPLQEATSQIYDSFLCPVFKGLTICISQLSSEERKSIKLLVEQNGGIYSGALRSKVGTHLVLLYPEGEKYRHAVSWNLHCVRVEWVYDSVNERYCKDEKLYQLEGAETLPRVSTPRKSLITRPNLDAEISKISGASVSCLDETARLDSVAQRHDLHDEVLTAPRTNKFHLPFYPTSLSQNRSLLLEEKENSFSGSLPENVESKKDKATRASVSSIVKERFPFSDKVDCDQQNYSEEAEQDNPEEFDLRQEKTDAQNVGKSVVFVYEKPGSEDFCDAQPDFFAEIEVECLSFKGTKFVVTGFGPKDSKLLTDMIVSKEGMVCDLNDICKIDVAIVPVFWDEQAVKAKSVATNCWLLKCIEDEKLLPYDENPLFKPICVHPPLNQPLHKCVISISQYTGTERDCLRHVIEVLGGIYQDYFVRKATKNKDLLPSTHLIAATPDGNKFEASKKWHIPAVTREWLIDAAKSGELPATELYLVEGTALKNRSSSSTADCGSKRYQSARGDAKLPNLSDEPQVEPGAVSKATPKVACGSQVKKFIQENKAQATSQSPADAVFLNPKVRYQPNFDVDDMLSSLDCSCSSGTHGKSVRKQSIPLDEMFSHNLSVALEMSSNAKRDSPPYVRETSAYLSRCARVRPYSIRPLKDVMLCVSKKLASLQGELHRTVASLGGDYCWNYDHSCTHFVFLGKPFDLNREFRLARAEGKEIVAPDWVIACKDTMTRVKESHYPHTYNSKMISASELSTIKRQMCGSGESELSSFTLNRDQDHGRKVQKLDVNMQLDELIGAVKAAHNKRRQLFGVPEDLIDPYAASDVQCDETSPVSKENLIECGEKSLVSNDEQPASCEEKSPVSNDEKPASCEEKSPVSNEKHAECEEKSPVSNEKSIRCDKLTTGCNEKPTTDCDEKLSAGCDEKSTAGCDEKSAAGCDEKTTGYDEKPTGAPKGCEFTNGKENAGHAASHHVPISWVDSTCRFKRKKITEHVTIPDLDPRLSNSEKLVHVKSDSKESNQQGKKTSNSAPTIMEHHSSKSQGIVKLNSTPAYDEHHSSEPKSERHSSKPLEMVIHHGSSMGSERHSSKSPETVIPFGASASFEDYSTEPKETVIYPGQIATATGNVCGSIPQKKIMFSKFSIPERIAFAKVIQHYGGEVSGSQFFDPTATHLLLAKPLINEKLLASVASGKWILHESYIDAMKQYETLNVDEEEYEWGSSATENFLQSASELQFLIACCAQRWRFNIQSGESSGAFFGWKVLLFAEESPLRVYSNILKAGGATVVAVTPLNADDVELGGITHAILHAPHVGGSLVNIELLMAHGIMCLKSDYLVHYLVEHPPPPEEEYLLPEAIQCLNSPKPAHLIENSLFLQ